MEDAFTERLQNLSPNGTSLSSDVLNMLNWNIETPNLSLEQLELFFSIKGGNKEPSDVQLKWENWTRSMLTSLTPEQEQNELPQVLGVQSDKQDEEEDDDGDSQEQYGAVRKHVTGIHREAATRRQVTADLFIDFRKAIISIRSRFLPLYSYLVSVFGPDLLCNPGFWSFLQIDWLKPSDHTDTKLFLQQQTARNPYIAFSMLISFLERALGDIIAYQYLSSSKFTTNSSSVATPSVSTSGFNNIDADSLPTTIVPRKLNDVLVHTVVEEAFNKDMLFLLRVMIGPPQAMNLRNVIWHGFMTPQSEFHPVFLVSLLLVIHSLHTFLPVGFSSRVDTPQRNLVNLYARYDQPMSITSPFPCPDTHPPLLMNLDKYTLEIIQNLIRTTAFITPQRKNLCLDGLQSFYAYSTQPTAENRIELYRALTIFTPQLEHSLRRIFVLANNCMYRLLTAESRRHYTTLDLLLDEKFQLPVVRTAFLEVESGNSGSQAIDLDKAEVQEGENNRIHQHVQSGPMHLMYDMFMWWPEGPRIRDLISHGALDHKNISLKLSDRFLALMVYLMHRFGGVLEPTRNKEDSVSPEEVAERARAEQKVRSAIDYIENYEGIYHPVKYLEREIKSTFSPWQQLQLLINKQQSAEANIKADSNITNTNNNNNNAQIQEEQKEKGEEQKAAGDDKKKSTKSQKRARRQSESSVVGGNNNTNSEDMYCIPYFRSCFDSKILSIYNTITQITSTPLLFTPNTITTNQTPDNFKLRAPVFWSRKQVNEIDVLRSINKCCETILVEIIEKLAKMEAAVLNRTATAVHRAMFTKLRTNYLTYYHGMITIIQNIIQERVISMLKAKYEGKEIEGSEKEEKKEKEKSEAMRSVLDLVGRQCPGVSSNTWSRTSQVFLCWMGVGEQRNDEGAETQQEKKGARGREDRAREDGMKNKIQYWYSVRDADWSQWSKTEEEWRNRKESVGKEEEKGRRGRKGKKEEKLGMSEEDVEKYKKLFKSFSLLSKREVVKFYDGIDPVLRSFG